MTRFTQDDRYFRVTSPLGDDALLLRSFTGVEGISRPFDYRLNLLSTDSAISGEGLVGEEMTVTWEDANGDTQYIHGKVGRFRKLHDEDRELARYEAELVPWCTLLTLGSDCRVFQGRTVRQIVQQIFDDAGHQDYEFRLNDTYTPREYCVQYRESSWDFVSRLLEEEGIFYFFEHHENRHVLVLADSVSHIEAVAGRAVPLSPEDLPEVGVDVLTAIEREDSLYSGSYTLEDYDPMAPTADLRAVTTGAGWEDLYDYPGGYTERSLGDRLSRIRLEEREAMRHLVTGQGTARHLRAGRRFEVDRAGALFNLPMTLVEVEIDAANTPWSDKDFDPPPGYSCRFSAIPHRTPFRPPRKTPRPVIRGVQTAWVVGRQGEEIWTDAQGRVKVKFHWDRHGPGNEDNSCWVRVASFWAGVRWGAIHLPRVGHEVVVTFLEGDPDRPLITGSVYNHDNPPPYELPGKQEWSGVKSRSTPNGAAENYNEILIIDKKGSELIRIHAEKNLRTEVEAHHTEQIGGHNAIHIEGARGVMISGSASVGIDTVDEEGNPATGEVDAGDYLHVLNNQVILVDMRHGMKCGEGYEVLVESGGHSITVEDGDQVITVKTGDQLIEVQEGSQTIDVQQGDQSIEVGQGNQKIQADLGNITVKAVQGKISLEAMREIELKVGGSTVKLSQQGVEIKGLTVKIEASTLLELKGLLGKVEASTPLIIKGLPVLIN